MTRVRRHTVRRGGKTHTRTQHDRRGDARSQGMKLRPRRAWYNAKRANLSLKHKRHASAALFATAAVTEITAFTVFRAVGGILFVAGMGLALLGAGLKART